MCLVMLLWVRKFLVRMKNGIVMILNFLMLVNSFSVMLFIGILVKLNRKVKIVRFSVMDIGMLVISRIVRMVKMISVVMFCFLR